MNNLNDIWHVDMQLDLTSQDKAEGLTPVVEFTKIGLIDWLLNDADYGEYCKDVLSYEISDSDLKQLLSEINSDWKVVKIESRK